MQKAADNVSDGHNRMTFKRQKKFGISLKVNAKKDMWINSMGILMQICNNMVAKFLAHQSEGRDKLIR